MYKEIILVLISQKFERCHCAHGLLVAYASMFEANFIKYLEKYDIFG